VAKHLTCKGLARDILIGMADRAIVAKFSVGRNGEFFTLTTKKALQEGLSRNFLKPEYLDS
jgi:hypothetical protein